MHSSNPQCRVRQCLNCEDNTLFYCFTCRRDLCDSGRKEHLHDLSTTFHDTAVYNVKKGREMNHLFFSSHVYDFPHIQLILKELYSANNDIISTIRSHDLFKRRALMLEIQSDIKTLGKKMSSYTIPFVTKAKTLCKLIDVAMYDKDNCSLILQNNKTLKMKIHIARIQGLEHRYVESANKPIQFISFIKTNLSKVDGKITLAQFSRLSFKEAFNRKNVIQLFSLDIFTKRDMRRLCNDSYLKMSEPELHQTLKLRGMSGCLHISHVRPDKFWVSDNRTNLVLFNEKGQNTRHLKNEMNNGASNLTGAHTVTKNNDLIYINTYNKIKRVSKKELNTICLEKVDKVWIYRCVYSSLSSGNLLVGMQNKNSACSKITRYRLDKNTKITRDCTGKLMQTIQYNSKGNDLYFEPCYITENDNGDVVVSDWKNGVVVTTIGGRHRFTFKKDPCGSVINPKGICTDSMSHILVCVLDKVMMLDKDGQFLSYILSMQPEIMITTNSLSFDFNTHCLWVGSVSDGRMHAYRYLRRQDALLGMYASVNI